MTINIPIEVPPELVKELHRMDDKTVKTECNDEIEKYVRYLELILKGWKTYKSAKEGHSRILFLMFKGGDKEALQTYEKQVLYPKMLEREKIELAVQQELKKRADAETAAKAANRGVGSSIGLAAEGVSSIIGYDDDGNPIVYDRVEVPDDYEYDDRSSNTYSQGDPDEDDYGDGEGTSEPRSSMSSVPVVTVNNHAFFEAIPEDDTVHGVEYNVKLSENIALAAIQVREALDQVDQLKANCPGDEKNDATRRDLLKLESKLIQSATEVAQAMDSTATPEWKTNPNLSKGIIKRRKKAAKKAAEAAEAKRQQAIQELEHMRQVKLAADALEMLSLQSMMGPPPGLEHVLEKKVEAPKPEEPFHEEPLPEIPLNEDELKVLMKIWNKSEEIEPGSEEQRIFDIYKENSQLIEEYILRNTNLAAMKNQQILQQMKEIKSDILDFTGQKQISKEEELAQAKEYIEKKLEFWEKDTTIQAPYYVQMYKYFQENMGYRIAGIITGYMPFETAPEAKFEQTMLLQYQVGKFFDVSEEEMKPLQC